MNVKMAENGSCSTDPDASRKPLYTFSDRTNRRLSQPSAVDEPAFSRADLSFAQSAAGLPLFIHHLRHARPLDWRGRQRSARRVQENMQKRQRAAEGLADVFMFSTSSPSPAASASLWQMLHVNLESLRC